MASFAQMGTMDIWYAHLDEDELRAGIRTVVAGTAKQEKAAKKAEKADKQAKAPKKGEKRAAKQALNWQILMKEELGDEWLFPNLFRIGASGLLTDIERQLSHHVTGRYAAENYMPMG